MLKQWFSQSNVCTAHMMWVSISDSMGHSLQTVQLLVGDTLKLPSLPDAQVTSIQTHTTDSSLRHTVRAESNSARKETSSGPGLHLWQKRTRHTPSDVHPGKGGRVRSDLRGPFVTHTTQDLRELQPRLETMSYSPTQSQRVFSKTRLSPQISR